jgi:uncharacterized protein
MVIETTTLIIVLLVGLFAGFINVIVGSGSSITIPILIFLGLPPHMAIGTNRFAMLFNNFTGAVRYHQKKKLNLKIAILFSVFAAVGAVIGALFVLQTKPTLLKQIIAFILVAEAIIIIFSGNKLGLKEHLIEFTKKHYVIGCTFGFLVGLYGGFIGMAMTSILIFLLVVLFSFKFIESAAIAKVITFVISLFATIIFLANLKVDILIGVVLTVAYVIGAYVGVNSAIKMGDPRVKTLFILVVISSAIKLLFF